jgi:hypothetical protein
MLIILNYLLVWSRMPCNLATIITSASNGRFRVISGPSMTGIGRAPDAPPDAGHSLEELIR